LIVLVLVADESLPGLAPITEMPMHCAVDQRREKDERSDEVDNFYGCPPFFYGCLPFSLKLATENAVPIEPHAH
jgi:hypothetical protein